MVCTDIVNYQSKVSTIRIINTYCPSCMTNDTFIYDANSEEKLLIQKITTSTGTIDTDKFWLLAGVAILGFEFGW